MVKVEKSKFVVIGSGGGGGTIAWMLARAGYEVTLLEQGRDITGILNPKADAKPPGFDPVVHDETMFRLRKPDPKRRPRGDYNTFRSTSAETAKPFKNGWTGSTFGGGSTIWGTWSFRALPIDFRLATHFEAEGQLAGMKAQGYSVADWPVAYADLVPFYSIAEALFAVNGNAAGVNTSITSSPWYKEFKNRDYFGDEDKLWKRGDFPGPAYPRNPVGAFVATALDAAGMNACSLPLAIVSPDTPEYSTRAELKKALDKLPELSKTEFWNQGADALWSEAVRDACNQCGFCGEYLCWGKRGPKSGTHITTLAQMREMDGKHITIKTGAKVVELHLDETGNRVTRVDYIDIHDPDAPKLASIEAEYVVVAGGSVQSARLLNLSKGKSVKGTRVALGNSSDQLGRHATWHMFGFAVSGTFNQEFQTLLRGELGPTGNTTSFWPYFVRNPADGSWIKAGTLTSTARKNPLDNAVAAVEKDPTLLGRELLKKLEEHPRSFQIRCTSDDMPMHDNRITLDPHYVDEYGYPVARITRRLGPNEALMQSIMEKEFERILQPYEKSGALQSKSRFSSAAIDLVGDHQMGSCRMGSDSIASVVDPMCRLWDAPNVFVVDSSFMPSGLGLNPMMTVVANALRVGSWMLKSLKAGVPLNEAAAK